MTATAVLDQQHFGVALKAPPVSAEPHTIESLIARLIPQKVMEGGAERTKPAVLSERSEFALIMALSDEANFKMKPVEEAGPPVVKTEQAPSRGTNFLLDGGQARTYSQELAAQGYEYRANVDYKAFRRSGMHTFEELVLRLQALNVDAQGVVHSRPGSIETEWRLFIRPSKPDAA